MINKLKTINIDFISKTRVAILFSCLIIGCGIISLLANHGPNLSIDFTGGTVIRIEFNSEIEIDDIRFIA